jgi:D-alanyl-D-alanine dipeptidase
MIALAWLVTACSGPTPTLSPLPSPSTAAASSPSASPSPAVSIDVYAPPGFVDLSDVDPTIVNDIRYYSDHNFVGRRIDGYLEPRCLLAEPTAQALHRAQTAARERGYSLKVYDCYRPARAGEDFARWAHDPDDQLMKGEFYPDEPKSRLFADGYVGGGTTTHSSGTAST